MIPTIIAENTQSEVIPDQVKKILPSLHYFLAEDIRTARRFLSSLKIFESIEALHFQVLDKKTKESELKEFLKLLKQEII